MLTSSPAHSPTIHSSASSPVAFHSRSYISGSFRPSPSLSPRKASRPPPASHHKPSPTSPASVPSSSLRSLAVSQTSAPPRQTVDAGTQYSPPPPPLRDGDTKPAASTLTSLPTTPDNPDPAKELGKRTEVFPPSETLPLQEPASPDLAPQSATSRSKDRASPSDNEQNPATQPRRPSGSSPKRPRHPRPAVIVMPAKYELCDVKDLVVLISDMLMELVRFNDDIPLKDGRLTRFHSRYILSSSITLFSQTASTQNASMCRSRALLRDVRLSKTNIHMFYRAPPTISIPDYLSRLTTHATLSPPLLLSMVFYIDRLCALYPAFVISSLTVHRFLITAATVASKGLSDSFWTNATYARVGGVSLRELALLELELLAKIQWRIVPKPEVLGDYYRSLVERSEGFRVEEVEEGNARSGTDGGVADNVDEGRVAPKGGISQSRSINDDTEMDISTGPIPRTSSAIEPGVPCRTKLTVLISGNGSNLQALISATGSGLLSSCAVVRVISNRKAAYGLQRASNAEIPTAYHNLVVYKNQQSKTPEGVRRAREIYDADLASLILADSPDLVVCAGFMHVLSPHFLDPLSDARVPVINLHPALPGKFDGVSAIERAYEAFLKGQETVTGAMVHYVIKEVDRGEVILAREVEMREGEGLDGLTGRIHEVEWDIIVKGTEIAVARLWETRKRRG
ncbi:MAG: hypothetical protein M1837_001313 [Sclerophora amabilis]|nr:MAG: hypothetical protein M1837_001313 [Sclerophora amabilis]